MTEERIGKIIYVNDIGLAVVLEEGLNGQIFPFSFDKIDVYHGENPKDLKQFSPKGLRYGVLVKFSLGTDSKVSLVRPIRFFCSC